MAESKQFTVEIIGVESLQQLFTQLPLKLQGEATINAFKEAAKPVKRALALSLPANISQFKQIIKIKAGRNKQVPSVTVGFSARTRKYTNRYGKGIDAWYIVYWLNYGTYARRDPLHTFANTRKAISRGVSGGIRPRRFFNKTINKIIDQAQSQALDHLNKGIEKVIKKYARKA